MNITGILWAVLIVALVGLFIGVFLGFASVLFKVNVDEREEKIADHIAGQRKLPFILSMKIKTSS